MSNTNPVRRARTVDQHDLTNKETRMSRKRHTHFARRAMSKTKLFHFVANGKLHLATNVACPITLQATSFDGAIPAFVELKPDSGSSEIAFRVGFSVRRLKLSVRGRQFSARIARRLKNTPLLWLHASDVFAGLFPAESRA